MAEQFGGAADWRSESEKRKSLLRKACISMFKTWIPDHPEASMARGEVFGHYRDALQGFTDNISLVSLLSFGSEDMFCHDFLATPLSMQELLVQREGTDAFLDPKNALRVVRRKFGMMTLIARMASTLEQRNIVAIRVTAAAEQVELVEFGRILSTRVEGTAAEEEISFKKRLRSADCPNFEVIYHSDLIGRRIPVPWPVKELYSLLSREYRKKRTLQPEKVLDFAHTNVKRLNANALKQMSLYAEELQVDLDAGELNPFPEFAKAADERLMLTATRSIFDEFQELRKFRRRERGIDSVEFESGPDEEADQDPEITTEDVDTEAEFLAEAEAEAETGGADEDEFLRLARCLELIRATLGKAFFHRISMVSGDVNFIDAAQAGASGAATGAVHALDPMEALLQARDVTEPFYKARSLSAVVEPLVLAGLSEQASSAASEALAASRSCPADDMVSAYIFAIPALIAAQLYTDASSAVSEALARAHDDTSDERRAASLMRVCSTLMESGPLPPAVRRSLARSILGHDIHFWGKSAVKSPLIEVILSLLSGVDDDTLIFLQKVVVHPDDAIRKSVLRTLPLGESEHIRNMLISHLKDSVPDVRVEVVERIGVSADPGLSVYLVNQFRHNEAQTNKEKRALAMNLARLGPKKHLPIFNAMLGKLATKDARFIQRYKPIGEDSDYQIAALEVLFYLKNRDSRRLIYNAATKGRGKMKAAAARVWNAIKNEPYGAPCLPRSSQDPEYEAEHDLSFDDVLAAYERVHGGPDLAAMADQGFLGRMKAKFLGEAPPTMPPTAPPPPVSALDPGLGPAEATETEDFLPVDGDETAVDVPSDSDEARTDRVAISAQAPTPEIVQPLGPPRAGLRFEAVLSESGEKWTGMLPMKFQLFEAQMGGQAIWSESLDQVIITAGRFEVLLGVESNRLPGLPNKAWLGVEIQGEALEPRTELSKYQSVIQG